MDGAAWWAAVHGVSKSWTRLSDFTFTFHFLALETEMATHSSVLACRIPEMGEPSGLPFMGLHRVGHDWSDLAAAAAVAAAAVPAKTLRQVQISCTLHNTWEHLHACLYCPPSPRPSINFAPLPRPTSSCLTLPQIALLQPARPSCSREVKLVLPQDIYTCNPFFFFKSTFIGVQSVYNTVLVSTVQQNGSVMHIHICHCCLVAKSCLTLLWLHAL